LVHGLNSTVPQGNATFTIAKLRSHNGKNRWNGVNTRNHWLTIRQVIVQYHHLVGSTVSSLTPIAD
uniref:Phage tail protein n=1 Tax=Anisakis simplex TaxID=6269 RepID=A0A0M3JFZ5_ANISI